MAKSKKRQAPQLEHTSVHVNVTHFDASVDATVNHHLFTDVPRPHSQDEYALQFDTRLEITGVCTYPDSRAGDLYFISIWREVQHKGNTAPTLRDYQETDEEGSPTEKWIRGTNIPVYSSPNGIAGTRKRHGERIWDIWLIYPPRVISDMLLLLSHTRPLFLSMHETRAGKKRWIRGFRLQSVAPE